MNAIFGREIYIRLTDDRAGLVCTVKYGRFYTKVNEFALGHQLLPREAEEESMAFLRKRGSHRAVEHH